MKTIFKKGMTVYDSLNFTKLKGEIVEIKESDDKTFSYPVVVRFDGVVNDKFYSEDGVIAGSLSKTLSTKPYEVKLEGFEQKSPIPTFKELYEKSFQNDECYWLNNLAAPNAELGEAVEAMLKLLFYREYYNDGWVADWNKNNTEVKHCIEVCDNNFVKASRVFNRCVLAFKSEEIRNKFLEEQIELLEIAKPLL